MSTRVRVTGCLLTVLAILHQAAAAQAVTAAEAIRRITSYYASAPPANTVDTVKAGDTSVMVTAIATTFMDTMDVLREANRRGVNLVITHEPTFYNHLDDTTQLTDDPVYREKLAFIRTHHMVVFRLHDQVHLVSPDRIVTGLVQDLGWQQYKTGTDPVRFTIPKTTLLLLSRELVAKFNAGTLRVVGDPNLEITKVAIVPGAAGLQRQVRAMERDDVQVVLAGESAEWEGVEYTRDAVAQGRHKALILLGHEVSEEAGMRVCAEDIQPLFPKLPVIHIAAGQPLWSPINPPENKSH